MSNDHELVRVQCPDCGKLLFRAAGPFDIEIVCDSIGCRKHKESRIKRLTYPNELGKMYSVVHPQSAELPRSKFGAYAGSVLDGTLKDHRSIGSFDVKPAAPIRRQSVGDPEHTERQR